MIAVPAIVNTEHILTFVATDIIMMVSTIIIIIGVIMTKETANMIAVSMLLVVAGVIMIMVSVITFVEPAILIPVPGSNILIALTALPHSGASLTAVTRIVFLRPS